MTNDEARSPKEGRNPKPEGGNRTLGKVFGFRASDFGIAAQGFNGRMLSGNSLPEGELRIARQFTAGCGPDLPPVPKGRMNPSNVTGVFVLLAS
jgi:hypothetical protein